MKHYRYWSQLSRWFNLPTGVLLALLQRTPVVQFALSTVESVLRSPAADVLKAAVATAVALGAVDTVAGATTLTATTDSPLAATVGKNASVAFGVLGTLAPPGSWTVGGTLPPGMAFYNTASGTAGAVTSGIINTSTLYLRGTPTAAGAYSMTLVAWESPNGMDIKSPTYSYSVNVTPDTSGPPTIMTNPSNQSVTAGANVTFNVTATGSGITYQWQKNSAPISGATAASLTLSNVQTSDAGNYTVVVTTTGGSVTSAAASLTVAPAPDTLAVFTTNPMSQTLGTGSDASFIPIVTGNNLTYQWQKNGVNMSGATSAVLTLKNIQSSDAGSYVLWATNGAGQVQSAAATLAVVAPLPGRLINMSVRSAAGTGSQTLIAGFIISGSGTKPVMIRASGPSLTHFGVTGVVADPLLDLYQAQTNLAENDSWTDAPDQSAIIAAHGDQLNNTPLDTKDCIILSPLPAGLGYTAQMKSKDGSTGVGLIEIYDTDTAQPGDAAFAAQPRLTNISARSQVGTDANILISGFVINGNIAKRLMIRGTGPTLQNFSVTGVLADPYLKLYNGQNLIAVNDNWGDAPNVSEIVAAGGDKQTTFTLDAKESVILVTLPPGIYTAQVSGVNNTTGVGLVEVFDLQ